MNSQTVAGRLLFQYRGLLSFNPELFANGSRILSLPLFSEDDIKSLCFEVEKTFTANPAILELTSPIVIVGDLHGQILDLFRILKEFKLPDKGTKYLFLGDIVDRGDFSLETVSLVFALRAIYPENVFIIRGNHEFTELCSNSGFKQEIIQTYDSAELFESFIECFNYMPIAAVINQNIVCVHGGIGPNWFALSQIKDIKRPISDFDNEIIASVMWSDPTYNLKEYGESPRGSGHLFGEDALNEFLHLNSKSLLVRGHECVQRGCEYMFNEKLITVFSASNYCGRVNNESATFVVKSESENEIKTFPPLVYLTRENVQFRREKNAFRTKAPRNIGLQSSSTSCIPLVYKPSPPVSPPKLIPKGRNSLVGLKELVEQRALNRVKVKSNKLATQPRPTLVIPHH